MKFEEKYNTLFNIIFSLLTILYLLKFVNIDKIDGISIVILICILFLFVMHSLKYGINRLKLTSLILFFVTFILNLFNGFTFLEITYFFLLYTIILKDNKKFFKIHFITLTVFVLTIILLSHIGYISNFVIYRSNGGIRNSLGFVHPNSLGLMIYSLTVCSLNLFEIKRFKFFFYLFLLLMNLWILQLADSRTSGYISILVILFCYFFDKMGKLNRPLNSFFINLAITVSVLFITLMSINFEANSIFQFLNKLFTNRIFSSYVFFREYGITLFGTRIDGIVSLAQGTVIIDSGYVGLLLYKGIIFFVLFLLFIFSRIKEYSFTLRESILLISVFISLMFESYGYTVFLFPILFFDYLGKRKESINE